MSNLNMCLQVWLKIIKQGRCINKRFQSVLYRDKYWWHSCFIASTYQGFVNLQNNTNGTKIRIKSFEIQHVV